MLHTDAEFLSAIAAQPADRTLRLVYADWLDEQSDPRGELARIEEEMRALPPFSDRFWELKSRRNTLRARAGAEWCGLMRCGLEYGPVFGHGVPVGWRERWRLAREFAERWFSIPMSDVGGRPAEIAEAETRLGVKLPASLREWIAFGHDSQLGASNWYSFWNQAELTVIDGGRSVLLDNWRNYGVRIQFLGDADPAVYAYEDAQRVEPLVLRSVDPVYSSVTELALCQVMRGNRYGEDYYLHLDANRAVVRAVERALPLVAQFSELKVHEARDVVAAIEQGMLWLKVAPTLDFDTLPGVLSDFIREWDQRRAAGESDPIPF